METPIINFQWTSGAQERKSWRTKIWDDANDAKFKGLVGDLEGPDRRLILRAKNISWMTVQGTMITDIVLAATEFSDFLCPSYDFTPPNLKKKRQLRSVLLHGISCSDRGLIITRHKKVHDELLCLAWRAFPYQCVRGKPLIHQGRSRSDEEIRQGRDRLETIDDALIWGLWESQTDSIIDVRFGD